MKTILLKIKMLMTMKNLDFRIRLFNIMAMSGALISFFTVIQSIIMHMWMIAGVSLMMMILSLSLLQYAVKSKNYQRCYYITIFVIFMFFFPLLFFQSGGYKSGVPAVFIFAVLFTVLMIEGKMSIVISALELMLYAFICWIAYRYPHLVVYLESEADIVNDIIFSYTAIGLICGIVLYFHIKEYAHQRSLLKDQNEKLQYYDEVKSTFLTTVAHEIKNPLNIISLYAQDTYEIACEDQVDVEQIKENQAIVTNTVVRLDRIVIDLMDTVSIEQGRLNLSIAPMDMVECIHECVRFWCEKETKEANRGNVVQILTECTEAPIMADYARIFQVLTNLLSNASLHTHNGTITVTLKVNDKEQCLSVKDTGEGMDDEVKKNAFKGYVSTSKDYWRHGIGLYICHQIIEAHKGRIWIESEKGKGTQIFFTLPIVSV